jgi:hypothetical protein
VYDVGAVPDLLTFTVRFTFMCPLCKKLNDQSLTIKATSREAAQQAAVNRFIQCEFCPAKVWVDSAMLQITEA